MSMYQSRKNDIIHAVNSKTPKEKAGLKNAEEREYFDTLMKEAEEHEGKYGFWPTFEMGEMEYDDPRLDIYSESAEEWAKEKKSKKVDEIEEV